MTGADILKAVESGTHAHVIGSTGVGKSYFLEWIMRDAVSTGRGFCFVDRHGETYDRLLRFLAYIRPRREVILLNPSRPDYIVPFNPFIESGPDATTTVARRVNATIKPWGAKNTDLTPTLERIAKMTYHFAVRAGETLPNAALLLRYSHREVAEYANQILVEPGDDEVREDVDELRRSRTEKEWGDKVLSSKNRFSRFIGNTSLQTFLGLKERNIRIRDVLDRDAIVLVNLARSDYLDIEPARVFAALLLNEFREAAMRRAGTRKHYHLILDEFQEYITFDLAAMLDETRKGGVHLTLAHQRLGHLDKDQELDDAIFANCGVKAVFGGLPYKSAATMANELYLDRINQRDVKETFFGQRIEGYDEMTDENVAKTVRYHADEVMGESVTTTPRFTRTPRFAETITSRSEWSREEKVSRIAQELQEQAPQRCTLKLPGVPAGSFDVPTLKDYPLHADRLKDYEREANANAYRFEDARRLIEQSRIDFLERVKPKPRPAPQRRTATKKGDPTKPPFRKNP